MPRHGMTAPGLAVAGSGGSIRRRRGLTAWPIRRKLVALVAGPLLVILGAGAYVTTQAVEQLRQAQDAQKVATATLESNRLSQALEGELLSSLTLHDNAAAGTATRLKNSRAVTDQAYAALAAAEADPPRGGWDARLRIYFRGVANSKAKLATVRNQLYKGGIDPSAFAGKNPPASGYPNLRTLQLDFASVFEQPRALTQQLANLLTTTTGDGRAVNTASVISALSQATSEAADEVVNTNIALTSVLPRQGDTNLAADLQNTQIRQQDLLSLAQTHATPEQQQAIAALNQTDTIISGFRKEALAAAHNGAMPGSAKGDAVLFTTAAGQRLANLDTPGQQDHR